MATTHIFIDTNIALHYKRPDQIDWKSLCSADSIVLVAAPILLSELEQQKVHNPSRRLRERADAFIRWLFPFVRDPSIEVRSGVRWYFISCEAQIDFKNARLSPDVADDHLIASVLCYMPEDGGATCVATGDIGLEVKLRSRKITSIYPSDDFRLPNEPDAQERELQELRRQLAQRRVPVLALKWADGTSHYKIDVPGAITCPSDEPIAVIRSRVPLFSKPEEKPASAVTAIDRFARFNAIFENSFLTPERIDRYNSDVRAYYLEYEKYLEQLLDWERGQSLTKPLRLTLTNQGKAPASQIDVMLSFPEDILLLEKDDLPKKPQSPEAPRKLTSSLAEMISPQLPDSLIRPVHSSQTYHSPALQRDGDPDIDGSGCDVSFPIATLKHSFDFNLNGVYFRFPSLSAARSFQVQYHLSAAELPDAITGSLHVVLDDLGHANRSEE